MSDTGLRSPLSAAGASLRRELEERIGAGEWPPGHRLPGERALAVAHGVSRPVVREVLRTLSAAGLVEISPARGTFVRRPTGSDLSEPLGRLMVASGATVRDVAAARMVVEGEVARLAALRRGGSVLARLQATGAAVDDGHELLNQGVRDLAYHSLLTVASGNPVLRAMHRSIAPYILFMMLRRGAVSSTQSVWHRQITEAVADGDPERARELILAHLGSTQKQFGADYDRPVDTVAEEDLSRISGGLWNLQELAARALAELDELIEEETR